MKVQSTFYIDFISKTADVLLISSFIKKMTNMRYGNDVAEMKSG